MAPRREQKKRMGKKHRQASTRPKLGKSPRKGSGSAVTGAVAPKARKKLAGKQAAAEKAKRTPAKSPEFEHRIIVGDMDDGGLARSGRALGRRERVRRNGNARRAA